MKRMSRRERTKTSSQSETDETEERELKVCILGSVQVGKTSLVVRFTKDKFDQAYETTIGASFLSKRMTYEGKKYKYNIWDTAGQERFKSITSMFYRGASVVIIVYDITLKKSFEDVQFWVKEVQKNESSNVVLVIVGNKLDLAEKREISTEEGKLYAERLGAFFIETSAKTSKNITNLFKEISKRLPPERKTAKVPNCGLPRDTRNVAENSKCCS